MKYWIFFAVLCLCLAASLSYVLLMLPPEESQGLVQKIFFFHVPSAFSLYLALTAGALISGYYLYDRKEIYDHMAKACLYTATFFSFVVIISGPIWAKPIWGTYWTWDPRLTMTFIVFILLISYCFVRKIFEDREGRSDRGAVIGAIIAILALLDAPLIHFSVKLWRGIHPSVLKTEGGLPDNFRTGLELMILSFFLLAGFIFILFFKTIQLLALKNARLHRSLKVMEGEKNA